MSDGMDRVTSKQVRRELRRMDEKQARRRAAIAFVVILALAFAAGSAAAKLLFTLASIRTDGMSRALRIGDYALCVRTDAPYIGGEARRGSLALVRWSESGLERMTVRRVIAMADDVVSVDSEGRVTLNDMPLEEPYATYRTQSEWAGDEATAGGALENPFGTGMPGASSQEESAPGVDDIAYPFTVPAGQVFVLCDNRGDLLDSRSSRFGTVSQANIKGLPRAILWPLYRVGPLGGGTDGE